MPNFNYRFYRSLLLRLRLLLSNVLTAVSLRYREDKRSSKCAQLSFYELKLIAPFPIVRKKTQWIKSALHICNYMAGY